MKKKIEKPEVKVLRLQETNVIATSSPATLNIGSLSKGTASMGTWD